MRICILDNQTYKTFMWSMFVVCSIPCFSEEVKWIFTQSTQPAVTDKWIPLFYNKMLHCVANVRAIMRLICYPNTVDF